MPPGSRSRTDSRIQVISEGTWPAARSPFCRLLISGVLRLASPHYQDDLLFGQQLHLDEAHAPESFAPRRVPGLAQDARPSLDKGPVQHLGIWEAPAWPSRTTHSEGVSQGWHRSRPSLSAGYETGALAKSSRPEWSDWAGACSRTRAPSAWARAWSFPS
jgi:hypothetical protein